MNYNDYNAAQLLAVTHDTGPAMVLAGPGSGKTAVIVGRLRYLIEEKKKDPSSILVITFTKAAAIEMQQRFLKLTDNAYPEVSFGTFHSCFYQIIRSGSLNRDTHLEIASESFKYELIKDILNRLCAGKLLGKEEYEASLDEIPQIISEISRIKNLAIDPDTGAMGLSTRHCFSFVYNLYNDMLRDFGRIDFDDMLGRCYELLSENKSILDNWQKRFSYILVDEYQDINPVQYKVLRLLAGDRANIFAVGDDDQSIYGFRGSDPTIMLGFVKDFEGLDPKMIQLSTNYRCGSKILENALLVIDVNTMRFKKDLKAYAGNGAGSVVARRYKDRDTQARNIALFLSKHMDELSNIAILYRTNSEAAALAGTLNEYGIPTTIDKDSESIFEDRGVQLVLSYISFAYDGYKRADYLKIINSPMRYISRQSAECEVIRERDVLDYYKGNKSRQTAVKEFFKNINFIAHLRPSLAVRYIRKTIGVDDLHLGEKKALDKLGEIALEYESCKKFLEFVREEELKMREEAGKQKKKARGGKRVRLMTMHASKGLEFKIVWLPDLNEGIIPSRSAVTMEQTEEERRMLYVAMTRAKQALIMSYITGNEENPMMPTRFIRPIKNLWDENYARDQRLSESSSGSSTSSSNSASSR